MPTRVLGLVGTRPEAIKLAPVALAARAHGAVDVHLVCSGQHPGARATLEAQFGIGADELECARVDHSLPELTATVLRQAAAAIDDRRPDLVLVQGDTATALAGMLAAVYARVPVVHLEAGLRTTTLAFPFPEEAHRRLIAVGTGLHLAPTRTAAEHLVREGHASHDVVVTGNTVVDAALTIAARRAPYSDARLEALEASGRPIVVVTAHRRESWAEPMRRITSAVAELAARHPDVAFVFVQHPNPTLHARVLELVGGRDVMCVPPLAYDEFLRLLARSSLVLTDSGGIQEEAPSFGVPVLVLRDETERMESVHEGLSWLVGTDPERIVALADELLERIGAGWRLPGFNPYGDGRAAHRAVAAMAWRLGLGPRPDDYSRETALAASTM